MLYAVISFIRKPHFTSRARGKRSVLYCVLNITFHPYSRRFLHFPSNNIPFSVFTVSRARGFLCAVSLFGKKKRVRE